MAIIVNCYCCGKELRKNESVVKKNKSGKFYCDRVCRGKSETKILDFKCPECGKEFSRKGGEVHYRSKIKFCTVACANRYYNKSRMNRVDFTCDYCGKVYSKQPSQVNGSKSYCSKKCKDSHHHIFVGGDKSSRWNPNLTDNDRLRLRKSPEYREWRKSVITRDGCKCLRCGSDDRLVSHHILNHTQHLDKSLLVDNGATLCSKCHIKFHGKYGNIDNDLKQFKEFLKDS